MCLGTSYKYELMTLKTLLNFWDDKAEAQVA